MGSWVQAVLVDSGEKAGLGMKSLQVFSLILLGVPRFSLGDISDLDLKKIDLSAAYEEVDLVTEEPVRLEKSLLNSFPFKKTYGVQTDEKDLTLKAPRETHHFGSSRAHAAPSPGGPRQKLRQFVDPRAREERQEVLEESPSFTDLASSGRREVLEESPIFRDLASNGRKCIDKVELVEETEYDTVITCEHSYDKRCHTSYTTGYDAVQEEECEENFKKTCFIEMMVIAFNETTEVCRRPMVKDCDTQGEEVCRTEYQAECWTKQIPHQVEDDVPECKTVHQEMCRDEVVGYTSTQVCEDWPHEECSIQKKAVTKYTPMTGCEKVPTELCAPQGCGFKQGPEECHPVTKTVVAEKPEETCSLEPQRVCKHVTKLVPKLTPKEECVDVPKEVCSRQQTNPRKVKRPVIKKWCYIPSEESGLADFA